MKHHINKYKILILLTLLVLIFALTFVFACKPKIKEVKVTFMVEGNIYREMTTSQGRINSENLPVPSRSGYVFQGWYKDLEGNTAFDSSELLKEDTILYAKWNRSIDNISFTVTFDSRGGSPVASVIVSKGSSITMPSEPQKDNKVFMGWYKDSECTQRFSASEIITKNITLYACWSNLPATDLFITMGTKLTGLTAKGQALSVITVPTKIGEKNINEIADNAFKGNTKVEEINISVGISKIGKNAFESCSELTDINIPETVASIGEGAFKYCKKLTGVQLPMNITYIPNEFFYGCLLLKSTGLRQGMTGIGTRSYYNCNGLTDIVIPTGVSQIGSQAFDRCAGIKTIDLSNTITQIASEAFRRAAKLESIVFREGTNNLLLGEYVFADCFSYTPGNAGSPTNTEITIPSTVQLGEGTFKNAKGITKIILKENITTIPLDCFAGLSNLVSVEIPNSVESIQGYAFSGCTSLITFELNENIKVISSSIFLGNTSLTSVVVKGDVTSIGSEAFKGCEQLSLVSFTKPNLISNIGISAFEGCKSLTGLDLSSSDITEISNRLFYGCLVLTSNVEGLVLPNAITQIGASAFENCIALSNISIPANTTTIGEKAFYGSGLINVTIGSNVSEIKAGAFSNCSQLESFNVEGNTKYSSNNGVLFEGTSLVAYPAGKNQAHYTIPNETTIILGDAFSSNTILKSVDSSNSELIEIGERAFKDSHIESFDFGNKIKTIRERAFINCNGLQTIDLPHSLETIKEKAFSACASLTQINLPITLLNVDSYAFDGNKPELIINCELAQTAIPTSWGKFWNYRVIGNTDSAKYQTINYSYNVKTDN